MKKSIYLVLLLVLLTSTSIFAQTPTFTWAKANYGGTNDEATGVAIDSDQNVIEIGSFRSYFTGGQFNLQGNILPQSPMDPEWNNYYNDEYIAKYNSSGELLWYKRTEGTKIENVHSVTTDSNNNIYVCGTYTMSNTLNNVSIFSVTVPNATSGSNAYVMKFAPTGEVLWFETISLTGGGFFQFDNLKTDGAGNVYVSALHTVLTISFGSYSLNHVFGSPNQFRNEACIFKFDTNGNPVWLKGIQGPEHEDISKIDVDINGNVYFSGTSRSENLNVAGTNFTTGATYSFFTSKLDTNGNVAWLNFLNPPFFFNEVAVDSNGNVYATGYTIIDINDFSPYTYTFGPDTVTIPHVNGVRRDNVMFVCKYSATGEELWMRASPGNIYMRGNGIEIDANDNIYVMGQYVVPTTFGGFTLPNSDFISNSYSLSNPEYKTFVAKITASGNVDWLKQTGNHFRLETADFEVDNHGTIVLAGKFVQGNSINFDGTLLSGYINSSSFRDSYIAKFNTLAPLTTPVVTALSSPYGLALDSASRLYVSHSGAINGNKISFANLNDTNPISTNIFTNLNAPTRLKLTSDNYLYVSESAAISNRISRAYLGSTTTPTMQPFITGLLTPLGLDVKDNNVYVGEFSSFEIKKVNTAATPFQSSTLINDLATDIIINGDFIYYTNPTNGKVYTNTITNPSLLSNELVTGIPNPSSILLHNGFLYISDSTEGKIYRANSSGSSTAVTLLVSGLNQPQSMVVFNNELYVAEAGANRVVKLSLASLSNDIFNGEFVATIFPNPTQNILNIQTQETIIEVSVYDLLGKKVAVNQISPSSIDVSNLAKGMYLIKVIGENDKTFSTKFIKQ